jgi:peroxiredoxin
VTLLADPEGQAIEAFGMRDPRGLRHPYTARAGTFLIDREGTVRRHWLAENYRRRTAPEEILRHLAP